MGHTAYAIGNLVLRQHLHLTPEVGKGMVVTVFWVNKLFFTNIFLHYDLLFFPHLNQYSYLNITMKGIIVVEQQW